MPFVSIRMTEGHSRERKNEIARRVTDAISEAVRLPKEAIWVVFQDVPDQDWYVGAETVAERRGKPR